MGTPEFAVGTLQRLVENQYNVVAVVTQPDKPVGRHQNQLQAPAVKQYALAHNIPVLQPVKMKDPEFVEQLRSYEADIQVVVAFRMLPEVVWAMPPYGTFNVHAALLPQYRGAAPINWAIINGETETGVTTFFLDQEIDTGRIIMQRAMTIPHDADVEYVYDHLMALGAQLATDTLDLVIAEGRQPDSREQATMVAPGTTLRGAPKLFKDNCRIDWNQPAAAVYNFVRGLSPIPTAWTMLQLGGRDTPLKIYSTRETTMDTPCAAPGAIRVEKNQLLVACADQWLEITQLQMAGKKRMAARDFLNGNKNIEAGNVG